MIRKRFSIITILLVIFLHLAIMSGDLRAQRNAPQLTRKPPRSADTTKSATGEPAQQSQDPKPEETPETQEEGDEPKKEKAKPGPSLWHDPGVVEELNFTYGAGGKKRVPQPPFTFLEEDTSGSNPKVKVRDANDREWGVKWGSEVNAEVMASRFAWAAGYHVEADYYVPSGQIIGAKKLERASKYIASDGSFKEARFEWREGGIAKFKEKQGWRWNDNPFVGTKELNGLKIVMMLTSNWDSKDARDTSRGSNTAIYYKKKTGEQRYIITDWGGSMGKWGGYFSREKWDCEGYTKQNREFITSNKNGKVEFGYKGQRTEDIREGISASDVKWIMQFLGRITDQQLHDGLKAAGATPKEEECFAHAIRARLEQLKSIGQI